LQQKSKYQITAKVLQFTMMTALVVWLVLAVFFLPILQGLDEGVFLRPIIVVLFFSPFFGAIAFLNLFTGLSFTNKEPFGKKMIIVKFVLSLAFTIYPPIFILSLPGFTLYNTSLLFFLSNILLITLAVFLFIIELRYIKDKQQAIQTPTLKETNYAN